MRGVFVYFPARRAGKYTAIDPRCGHSLCFSGIDIKFLLIYPYIQTAPGLDFTK